MLRELRHSLSLSRSLSLCLSLCLFSLFSTPLFRFVLFFHPLSIFLPSSLFYSFSSLSLSLALSFTLFLFSLLLLLSPSLSFSVGFSLICLSLCVCVCVCVQPSWRYASFIANESRRDEMKLSLFQHSCISYVIL